MVCWARVILFVGVCWFNGEIIGRLDDCFGIEWSPLERKSGLWKGATRMEEWLSMGEGDDMRWPAGFRE